MGQEKRVELALEQRSEKDHPDIVLLPPRTRNGGPDVKERPALEATEATFRGSVCQDQDRNTQNSETVKQCGKCGQSRTLATFTKNKESRDGLCNICKVCQSEYRKLNAERISAYKKEWCVKNVDRLKLKKAVYRKENKEQISKTLKSWRNSNQEKRQVYGAMYYRKNKQAHSQNRKAWYLRNRDSVIEHQRLYYQATRPQRRATAQRWYEAHRNIARINSKRRIKRKWIQALHIITEAMLQQRASVFGNACAYCGGPFEHWDHVQPLSRGGPHVLGNLRPSCKACNLRKHTKLGKEWLQLIRKAPPRLLPQPPPPRKKR